MDDALENPPVVPFWQHVRRAGEDVARVLVASAGTTGTTIGRAHVRRALPDPASDYLVVGAFLDSGDPLGPREACQVDYGAGVFELPRLVGAMTLSPADTYAHFQAESPPLIGLAVLPEALVSSVREELTGDSSTNLGPLHASAFIDPWAFLLLRRLLHESLHGAPCGALYQDHLVHSLVRCLLRRSGCRTSFPNRSRGLRPRALGRLFDYMQAHLSRPIGLDDLAAAAGIGRFELARSFKATMGQAPWSYFLSLRVERAAELLIRLKDQASLPFVAAECGFYDQSHLTRHFKRTIGITPGAFLRNLQP